MPAQKWLNCFIKRRPEFDFWLAMDRRAIFAVRRASRVKELKKWNRLTHWA